MQFRSDTDRQVLATLLRDHHWHPLHPLADPASLIVDVGAHGGYSTWLLANAYPDATVQAFEPDHQNFELAVTNLRAVVNARATNAALWHVATDVRMEGGSSNGRQAAEGGGIAGRPLSGLMGIARLSKRRIDYLKIDIEGAEYAVVEHAQAPLERKAWQRVDVVQIDCHGPTEPIADGLLAVGFARAEQIGEQVVAWR